MILLILQNVTNKVHTHFLSKAVFQNLHKGFFIILSFILFCSCSKRMEQKRGTKTAHTLCNCIKKNATLNDYNKVISKCEEEINLVYWEYRYVDNISTKNLSERKKKKGY